jgi:hypothetical protein
MAGKKARPYRTAQKVRICWRIANRRQLLRVGLARMAVTLLEMLDEEDPGRLTHDSHI